MELSSMLWGSLDRRGVWGRMDTCICMAESLYCSPETIARLLISYMLIQKKKSLGKNYQKKNWTQMVTQMIKNLPTMWETQVQSLCQEDHLDRGMATHSNILGYRTLWTEVPGRLQPKGLQTVRHNWAIGIHTQKWQKARPFSLLIRHSYAHIFLTSHWLTFCTAYIAKSTWAFFYIMSDFMLREPLLVSSETKNGMYMVSWSLKIIVS